MIKISPILKSCENSTERLEIPFLDVVLPYLNNFEVTKLDLSANGKEILKNKILLDLSLIVESTCHFELEKFLKISNLGYEVFIENFNQRLIIDYPVLNKILKKKVFDCKNHISKLISRFKNDKNIIVKNFNLNKELENLKIESIEINLGDGHDGEGTALIILSNGTKLIYKPRNVTITESYNLFINWVNTKLNIDLKTFKTIDCEEYGWLEFVNYEEANSEEDLKEYYYKAGILLAITLLLGSKDYHFENIIASGRNPLLIDHETIIQPATNSLAIQTWVNKKNKSLFFSVLESLLIVNENSKLPKGCVGFGIENQFESTEISKKIIFPNTINSKKTPHVLTRKLIDKNIPKYLGNFIFANNYKDDFVRGFSSAYNLFLKSKLELKSNNSPIKAFKNKKLRHIWRSTFVYYKILKHLENHVYLSSFDNYQAKLFDLLSKAYKGETMDKYQFLLDIEMKQMLKGDIPIFSLESEDDFLEGYKSFKIFESNCIENISQRIDLLSEKHKKEQLKLINNWLDL